MIIAPPPPNEEARLAALDAYQVLDTEAEDIFDEIVRLAARLTNSPIALISLVDRERQWFKSRHGLDAAETPRELAFCAHAILEPNVPMSVTDASNDPRFVENPLVTGSPDIRAYLGVPLVTPSGEAIGTLCVIDQVPRQHSADEIEIVSTLARAVVTNLELRLALRRSHASAQIDPLTGLLNRRALSSRLVEAFNRKQPVAVIMVDLDHFKEANDAAGHAAGDAMLVVAAERLLASVRAGDVVARLGGDEFAVLLLGVNEKDLAGRIAARISASLHQPVPLGGRSLRLGATLGIALAPADTEQPEMLLRAADEALMQAKRVRRGEVGWASRADTQRLARAAAVVCSFDAALDEDGISVLGAEAFLQPIVSLAPEHLQRGWRPCHVTAVEVLARWSGASVGAVPPSELFPLLGPERSAILGRAVRAKALVAIKELRAQGLTTARLAINLSPAEVARSSISEEIAAEVQVAGLPLAAIELEITEEVLLDRVSDRTLDGLAALRGRGARLVLDDFGTGNSGLSQLLRLPLDAIKLDKRFVQGLGLDTKAEEIVRATVSLARGLGLEVVAEGVETESQAELVAALGCHTAQGFLFARPMSAEQLRTWLRETLAPMHDVVIPLRNRRMSR